MIKAKAISTNFNAGEWSPRLNGRVDLAKYKHACSELTNLVLYPHGGMGMRPGMKYIGAVKDHDRRVRLIPFIFSSTVSYMLEFGEGYVRFYKEGAQILYGGNPYEVASPYSQEDLRAIQFRQSYDILYLVHPDYAPRKLMRYDDDDWVMKIIEFQDGPYLTENLDPNIKITPSATTGNITLTASTALAEATTGTWSDTQNGTLLPWDGASSAGFKFTVPTGAIGLRKVSVEVVDFPAANYTDVLCYLYTHSSTSPGTAVDIAKAKLSIGRTFGGGEKAWDFKDTPITPGSTYWLIFKALDPSALYSFRAVNHNASYGSGRHNTITSITDSLTTEYRVKITYTTPGTVSIFEAGHVGSQWRLRHSGSTTKKTISAANQFSTSIELYGKFVVDLTPSTTAPWIGRCVLQKSMDGGTTWFDVASFLYSTMEEFFETRTGVLYRVGCKTSDRSSGTCTMTIAQDERWGVVRITQVDNAYTAKALVVSTLGSTDPTPMWREGSWSDKRGFPSSITFHEDRLYFAGSYSQPTNLWSSWVGDYENMAPGDTDDAPLDVMLSKLDNMIQWIESYKGFLVGTLAEEGWVKGSGNKPITNTSIDTNIQTCYGTASNFRPVKVDQSLLFVQTQRRQVRELTYKFEADGYVAPDLTLLAEHITEGGILEMAYAKFPDSIVWCVRNDGDLVGLTYYRTEDVVGWHRHETDGEVESVAVIPTSLGELSGYDQVWMEVKRTINGSTKRYIEIMVNNEAVSANEDVFCVDCGITKDGSPSVTVTGLSHLEGETVAVLADGVAVADKVVSSGSITLDTAASVVQAGLPYTSRWRPMRLEVGSVIETTQTRIKRYVRLVMRFFATLGSAYGPKFGAVSGAHLLSLPSGCDSMDDTTDVEIPWMDGFETDGRVCIEQRSPCSMKITAAIHEVEIED